MLIIVILLISTSQDAHLACMNARALHERLSLVCDGPLRALFAAAPSRGARHRQQTKQLRCAYSRPRARCILFIHYLDHSPKSMHRQKPPRRTPACSCILCILFILFLNIERDIRRREEHMKWMQCTPTTTHPVSLEKSVQSMQSALGGL